MSKKKHDHVRQNFCPRFLVSLVIIIDILAYLYKFTKIKEILAAKVSRLEEMMEIKVQQQEILPTKNTFNSGNEEKSAILRTCHETRAAEPLSISGMYWVDPDGQGVGDDPIYVYCNMTTGILLTHLEKKKKNL